MEKKRSTNATNELEKGILRIRVEQSCWKNNNEKSNLVVGLWKTSQNYEVKFCHRRKQWIWIDMNKETRNSFHREDNEELGSFISTIDSNNP